MFLKDNEVELTIKRVLHSEGIDDDAGITKKIMEELLTLQHQKAEKGSKKATHPKKHINFDIVKKQLDVGVPFTQIAASQHVSEQTLKKRLKG